MTSRRWIIVVVIMVLVLAAILFFPLEDRHDHREPFHIDTRYVP